MQRIEQAHSLSCNSMWQAHLTFLGFCLKEVPGDQTVSVKLIEYLLSCKITSGSNINFRDKIKMSKVANVQFF